ncbi:MAG: hypothetical protein [Podoviridae sp. ctviO18]|nr:MAG: hypothetical protein [Podoviridae sp. ctviO18]
MRKLTQFIEELGLNWSSLWIIGVGTFILWLIE